MRQVKDGKLTYKMYKKGRFWVFAGIMMTTWQLNTMTVRAATNQTSTESSSVTATVSATNQSSTAATATSSVATSSASAASSTTSTSATRTTAVSASSISTTSAATSSVATSQSAVTSSVSAAKTVTSSSSTSSTVTSQVTTSRATVASSSASAVTTASSASSTSTATTSAVSATSSEVATSVASAGVTSVTTAASALTTTGTTALPTTTAVAAVAAVKPQVKLATTATTPIESGTFGTADWTLDSEGVLHIQAGTLVDSADDIDGNHALTTNTWQNNKNIKQVSFEGIVVGAPYMGLLFANDQNLTAITKTATGSFDVSKVESISQMFYQDSSLTTVDDVFINWNKSKITVMDAVFYGDNQLATIDVANWNTASATNMDSMFSMSNASSIDLSNWTFKNSVDLTRLLAGTTGISAKMVSSMVVKQVSSMNSMFANATFDGNDKVLDLSGWDMSSVNKATYLFRNVQGIDTVDISGWNLVNMSTVSNMFNSGNLKTIIAPNVILGKNVSDWLNSAYNVATINLANLDLGQTDSITSFLSGLTNLTSLDSSNWKTGTITDMSLLFTNDTSLTTLDLTGWDTSQVTDMDNMFYNTSLVKLDLANWDVHNVTDLSDTFGQMVNLMTLDLTGWVTSDQLVGTERMFQGDTKLAMLDLSGFDMSKVISSGNTEWDDDTGSAAMFDGMTALATLKLPSSYFLTAAMGLPTKTTDDEWTASVDDMNPTIYTMQQMIDPDYYNEHDELKNVTFRRQGTQTTFSVGDQQLIVGPSTPWQPVINGQDGQAGDPLVADNVTTTWTRQNDATATAGEKPVFDNDHVGTYSVLYRYVDQYGYAFEATGTVTLVASEASVTVPDKTTVENGATWLPATDFTGTNATGDALSATDEKLAITYDKPVDTTVAGTYQVTYTYTDSQGNVKTGTTTVTVLAPAQEFTVKNSTLIAGPKTTWSQADNFGNAGLDANGTAITLADVQVSGTVDPTKAGTYQVTYTYTDSHQKTQTETVTITVIASKAGLKVPTTTTVENGADWSPATNFTGTDAAGNQLDYAAVTVDNPVKTTQAGTYTVTYSYTDSQGNVMTPVTTQVTVLAPAKAFTVKDSTLIAGPKTTWSKADNFASAGLAANGTTITASNVQVTGTVDPTKAGTYQVTYTYTDSYQQTQTETATITVVASQASVTVPATTTIENGTDWSPATDFVGTDVTGKPLDYASVSVDNPVKTTQAGTYTVTYSYTDSQGNVKTGTTKVTVLAPAQGFTVKNSTLIAGPKTTWTQADNFGNAGLDANGTAITLADVQVSGTVDPTKVGTYQVTYTYTDSHQQTQTETVTITVVASKASLTVPTATTIENGADWTPATNFTGTDATGQSLAYSAVTVDNPVKATQAGTYTVTYSYTDSQGNVKIGTTKVTVLAPAQGVTVKDSTLIAGPKTTWSATDNFVSAGLDANGTPITFADVTVQGQVNPLKAGTYQISYVYVDSHQQKRVATATITVVASKASITVPTTATVENGSTWSPATNFVGTDVTGKALNYSAVSVDNPVKTTQAGTYKVTYHYTDSQGNVQAATTIVTVLAPAKGFTVKNQTLIAGPKTTWLPAANFATAGLDANGQAITLADLTVTGADQVKTNQPGTYQVTYTYTDSHQQTQTETATVTVVASKASITVPATVTVENGASWSPQTNFAGTTITGQALSFTAVTVDKQINTRQPGTTKVTYTYIDRQGNVITQATYVTVLAPARTFTVNNSTVVVNTSWDKAINFNGGVDANGQAITLADVTVTGTVDTTQPGRYQVTYRYTDSHGQTQTSTAIITVVAASKPTKPVITTPSAKPQPSVPGSQAPTTGSQAGSPVSQVTNPTSATAASAIATKARQPRYQAKMTPTVATKPVTTVARDTATSTAITTEKSQAPVVVATPTMATKTPQVTLATAQAQATKAVETTKAKATKAKTTKSAGTVARAKSTTAPKTKAAAIAQTKTKSATKTSAITTHGAVITAAVVGILAVISGLAYYFLKRH
ncbi:hypothetical protein C5Z25_02810 [Lactobacillus sp. CBA3605]|uniref:immunoglobulin-like domain-containing protein n=1 Tax=Lactobacillus sp. CBA3605 TaxID=2099788 RepID=UPI000CFA9756|nr:immunoglobulin-like domain-containing protein [Lactobacillus sp. CBA3605]AVK60742.1 hypothetical protein C5Z25_02810 [Lactobacillus sp. CBA3605]